MEGGDMEGGDMEGGDMEGGDMEGGDMEGGAVLFLPSSALLLSPGRLWFWASAGGRRCPNLAVPPFPHFLLPQTPFFF